MYDINYIYFILIKCIINSINVYNDIYKSMNIILFKIISKKEIIDSFYEGSEL